ncbi:PREDICTED: venom allergen 5-like isoform X1 [Bactrocera latifrons]|uniref:venom allergen 5-like isoform X1 n=1 Tax=Bactrocera latifrons TaxID=174628 RepID=UPI0008DE173C|nr:PREDICTED: venom allergen 5-like isoform X1 [Bactrocera latifrons]
MNVLLLHKEIISLRRVSKTFFGRFVIISMCILLKFIIIYIVVLDSYSYTAAYNYFCGNDDWCEKGKHIMCDPSAIENIGKFKRHMPSTFKIRYMFLELHNQLRNEVAGQVKATRMRNFIWDSELAYLARTYTGLCPSKPSECHKTARFEKVGLNSAMQDGLNRISLDTLMTTTFNKWKKDDSTFYKVLTLDQASRVGCAIGYCVDCPEGKIHCYFISCYYDMDYKEGVEINKGEKAASKCNVWNSVQDEKYTNLCRNTGKIF